VVVVVGRYLAVNQRVTTDSGCSGDCRACGSTGPGSAVPVSSGQPQPALRGGRFAFACVYVFVLPLLALILSQILLAGRLGELGAAAAGVAASVLLLLPAAWKLRRTDGKEVSHDTL